MRGRPDHAIAQINNPLQSEQLVLNLSVKKCLQVLLFFSIGLAAQVQAQATKPVADAGSPQSAIEGDRITLSGLLSSDPNQAPLTYRWTILTPETGIVLSSFTAAQPSFVAPKVDASTEYLFSLVVNNGTEQSDADSVTVTVTDTPPTAHAGADQTVNEGDEVTLDGSLSSSPDGTPLIYEWEVVSPENADIVLNDTAAANPTFTSMESTSPVTFIFRLVVQDNRGNTSGSDDVFILVDGNDDAPVVRINTIDTVAQQTTVTLDGSGSTDPEGQALTFRWELVAPKPGITLSDTMVAVPTFVAPMTDTTITQEFRLTVGDGTNISNDTITVTIVPNQPPEANAGNAQTVQEDTVVALSGSYVDTENDPASYNWTAPVGITLLPNARVASPTFTAPNVIGSTILTFSLVVNDGTASRPATVTITVNGDDDSPMAIARPTQGAAEGTIVSLNGSGQDPDSTNLTYNWTAPVGITLLPNARVASPTFTAPNVSGPTSFSFGLTVSDGNTESTPALVVVPITGSNDVPTASVSTSLQAVAEGELVTLSGSGIDPDSNTLFYNWRQISPEAPKALLSATAAPVFVAPNVVANTVFTFSLTINDGSQNSAAVTTTVTITGNNDRPTAHAGNDQTVSGGQNVTLTALASVDPENKSLTYAWTPPTTITLSSNADPTPVFTAPVVTSDTTFTFSLIVTDSDNFASSADTVNVTVRAISPQAINQAILAKVAPMLSGQIAASVAKRVSSAATAPSNKVAINGYTSLLDIVKHQVENLPRQHNIKALLNNSEFSFSLDADNPDNPNTECLSCTITFWGSGSYRSISTKEGGLDIDGNFYISQLGADSGFSDRLLIGATAMRAEGNFDYTRDLNKGAYELNIDSLYPYFGLYFLDKRLNIWGTLGYGTGNLKITTPNEQLISQIKNRSVAAGITGQAFNFGYNSLNIKGEITNTRVSVSGGAHVPMLEVDISQLKALVEVARVQNSPQNKKRTSIAAGLRYEDAISKDIAVEIAGDVSVFFATEDEGIPEFVLQANAYALIGKANTEWGIQGIFQIADEAGYGIYCSLTPSYGNSNAELNHIWSAEIADRDDSQQPQQKTQFEAQVGYGMKANGLLTPYAEIKLAGNANSYILGLRWRPTANVYFSLMAEHLENQERKSDQALLFKASLRL